MTGKMIRRLPAVCVACVVVSSGFLHAAPISVTDQKGRAIEIELVSLVNDSVTFRRAGKEFSLPISNFADASQELIRKEAARIPAVIPKIQPEVIIGKRRDNGDSYFMVKQDITCTIKLTNPSNTVPVPPLKGTILFIGQDRRTPDLFEILSTQSLEASIEPGKTFEKKMEPFTTTYDSDNKGVGNVGGAQYTGYILALFDDAGEVVLEQTATGSFRQALSAKPGLLKELAKHPKGKILTEKLEPAPVVGNVRTRP
jgi:hypothetical protein